MHIPAKTLKLRSQILTLQTQFWQVAENQIFHKNKPEAQRKAAVRDHICAHLKIDKQRYYRAIMSLDKINELTEWRKAYREKLKEDELFYLKRKTREFQKRGKISKPFTHLDIINKFGEQTFCSLTGKPVYYSDPNSYQLDHIVPLSKGGHSDLSNLQIVCPMVNKMKNDIELNVFFEMCELITSRNNLIKP
jgi:5-methylcytosine-specific restriction endonuclease McrA